LSAIHGAIDGAGPEGVEIAADAPDPEQILRAYLRWGDACVDRLVGDFAFVLWDGPRRRILAARDPLGVKPLHYRCAGGRFLYATFVSDLFPMGAPRIVDERRVADALVPELEGIDAEATFFEGIRRLPPGHRLVVEDGREKLERWWSPDASRELRLKDDREYVEAFLAAFREAVSSRLDPDTFAMLSGGLDSSAIAGVAKSVRPRLFSGFASARPRTARSSAGRSRWTGTRRRPRSPATRPSC